MYVPNLKLIRGCITPTSLFASFVELERNLLKYSMKPHVNEDGNNVQLQVNNVTCPDRYGKRCSIECPFHITGFVSGYKISWWIKNKTM